MSLPFITRGRCHLSGLDSCCLVSVYRKIHRGYTCKAAFQLLSSFVSVHYLPYLQYLTELSNQESLEFTFYLLCFRSNPMFPLSCACVCARALVVR